MSKYRIKQIIDGNGDSLFYPQRKIGDTDGTSWEDMMSKLTDEVTV